jgi:hypothetical protein
MEWDVKQGQEVEAATQLPDGVRDGDVLVYMSGRLLVVDHLVPEAYSIDLVELQAEDTAKDAAP